MNKRYNEQDPAPQYDPETARIRRALRAQKARRRKKMRSRRLFLLGMALILLFVLVPNLWGRAERLLYPRKYEALVERWADTYDLDPASLERQIKAVLAEGKYTPKAVVAVDILGNPCDYDAVSAVCERYGLALIENAAQSFGAEYHGKKACSFGRIATTSFFPAKPLGCYGDGGAVFTDDDALNDLIRSLCVHGKGPGGKYDNIRVGMNSRLDNLQAAVLLPKLKALADYETVARQTVAGRYNAAFAGKFTTPFVAEGCLSVWAQYALLAEDTKQRDRVIARLTEKGIPNMVYYPTPQHALPVFRDEPTYGETFRNANDYCARTFSLPMHPYLTGAEQETVIAAVLEAL